MNFPELNVATAQYGRVAAALHWVLALLLIVSFTLGMVMTDIPEFPPIKAQYYMWHKSLGLVIFGAAVVSVMWRFTHSTPPLPASVPVWQARMAKAAHGMMFTLMLLLPLSGYLGSAAGGHAVVFLDALTLPALIDKDETLAEWLGLAHQTMAYTMAAIVVVHVLAALKHHFVEKNGMLARMVPWRGDPER